MQGRKFKDSSPDDGARGEVAVIASLKVAPDGTVVVVLDDLFPSAAAVPEVRAGRQSSVASRAFFTHRGLEAREFEAGRFRAADIRFVGLAVLSRLYGRRGSDA
jgi:hypothetical protein